MEVKPSYRVVPNVFAGCELMNSLDMPLRTKKKKKGSEFTQQRVHVSEN
jgi:hypothetical protein